jgi:hypothetical protein
VQRVNGFPDNRRAAQNRKQDQDHEDPGTQICKYTIPGHNTTITIILTGKSNALSGLLKHQQSSVKDIVFSKLSYRLEVFCASILIPYTAQKPVYLSTKGPK